MGLEQIHSDFKPTGMLGGIYTGIQNAQAEEMNNSLLQKQAFENQIKEKDAAFAQDELNNPALRDWRMQGMIGENQSKTAKGAIDYATFPAKIKQDLAEIVSKTSEAEVNSLMTGLQSFVATAESNGPAGLSMAMQTLPPQYQQIVQTLIQNGEDPVAYGKGLLDTLTQVRADTPAHRSKMIETGYSKAWDASIHAADAAARDKTARATAGIHEAGSDKRFELQSRRDTLANKGGELGKITAEETEYRKQLAEVTPDPITRMQSINNLVKSGISEDKAAKLYEEELKAKQAPIRTRIAIAEARKEALRKDLDHLNSGGKIDAMPSTKSNPTPSGKVIKLD